MKKSLTRNNSTGKIRSTAGPKWLRMLRIFILACFAGLLILAIAGYASKYFHLISNHR